MIIQNTAVAIAEYVTLMHSLLMKSFTSQFEFYETLL